jgi:pimeloyl-ACP methyl ester carboxylesterase
MVACCIHCVCFYDGLQHSRLPEWLQYSVELRYYSKDEQFSATFPSSPYPSQLVCLDICSVEENICATPNNSVVIVPGFWGDPAGFQAVIKKLEQHGYHALVMRLPSCGCEPPNKALLDDVQEVHDKVKELVQSPNNVTVVMHSAGGFIAPEGLKGLLAPDLPKSGKAGGVTSLVYIAAPCMSVGEGAPPAPWFQYVVSNIDRLVFDDDMTYNGCVRGGLSVGQKSSTDTLQ